MKHDQWQEQIPYYVTGRLSVTMRAELEKHLQGCAACREQVREWRIIAGAVEQEAQGRASRLPPLDRSRFVAADRSRAVSPLPLTIIDPLTQLKNTSGQTSAANGSPPSHDPRLSPKKKEKQDMAISSLPRSRPRAMTQPGNTMTYLLIGALIMVALIGFGKVNISSIFPPNNDPNNLGLLLTSSGTPTRAASSTPQPTFQPPTNTPGATIVPPTVSVTAPPRPCIALYVIPGLESFFERLAQMLRNRGFCVTLVYPTLRATFTLTAIPTRLTRTPSNTPTPVVPTLSTHATQPPTALPTTSVPNPSATRTPSNTPTPVVPTLSTHATQPPTALPTTSVPNPSATRTPSPTLTRTPSNTPTPVVPTLSTHATQPPTAFPTTSVPNPSATRTPSPTLTLTRTPSKTPIPNGEYEIRYFLADQLTIPLGGCVTLYYGVTGAQLITFRASYWTVPPLVLENNPGNQTNCPSASSDYVPGQAVTFTLAVTYLNGTTESRSITIQVVPPPTTTVPTPVTPGTPRPTSTSSPTPTPVVPTLSTHATQPPTAFPTTSVPNPSATFTPSPAFTRTWTPTPFPVTQATFVPSPTWTPTPFPVTQSTFVPSPTYTPTAFPVTQSTFVPSPTYTHTPAVSD